MSPTKGMNAQFLKNLEARTPRFRGYTSYLGRKGHKVSQKLGAHILHWDLQISSRSFQKTVIWLRHKMVYSYKCSTSFKYLWLYRPMSMFYHKWFICFLYRIYSLKALRKDTFCVIFKNIFYGRPSPPSPKKIRPIIKVNVCRSNYDKNTCRIILYTALRVFHMSWCVFGYFINRVWIVTIE